MTATTDIIMTSSPAGQAPPAPANESAEQLPARPMIAVKLLAEHPGNVRLATSLDEDFLASIRDEITVPLRITPDGNGYRVIDGHRRLAAALKLGIETVPYDLVAERAGDEAGQYLDMYKANHHRKSLTALEEADALFSASKAGASKTRIRQATGLRRDQVSSALAAGKIAGMTRALAEEIGDIATLDQLALLAEFDGDDEAVGRLTTAFLDGSDGQHTAEQIRQQRTQAAEHEQLIAQLAADGYTISEEQPPYAATLHSLQHDGEELTAQTHAACPGRAVYFYSYRPLDPAHFCTNPEANGHTSRFQPAVLPDLGGGTSGSEPEPAPGTGNTAAAAAAAAEAASRKRKLVVEGNAAWVAAREVRKRWLAAVLFARRTAAPKEVLPFVTSQLLVMPRALRETLGRAPGTALFAELTGGNMTAEAVGGWTAGRLPLAALAVIAAAYEDRMDGDEGRKTWRTDQNWTQCSREEAGAYFRLLASVGYELSPVEQSVADGVPYTGSQPADDLDSAGTPDEAETPADGEQSTGSMPPEEAAVRGTERKAA